LREIAGLGVIALAAASAALILAGPSMIDPKPDEARPSAPIEPDGRSLALRSEIDVAAASPERARPIDAGGRAPTAAAKPSVRAGGMVPAVGLRGPLTPDRIAAAIDRAVEKGWLTIDPPGSEPSGMALFPPMGTQPLREGIIVPEGAELPPCYARHYQVTDGGEQLQPILILSPGCELVDASGQVIPTPDGIVPPGMGPEGIPNAILKPPKDGTGPSWP
jgi:hypothetical protein